MAELEPDQVITDHAALAEAESATFATRSRIPAILKPRTVEQLQTIVRIAREHGAPLYPVSRGRNWGLGSRVPVSDGCALVELGMLNRILEFDEALSYITVQAGVTFQQVADFLEQQGSKLFLSVIGGPPDASLIGNALERGEGLGPLGERAIQICGFEAVLGDGTVYRSGYSAYTGSKLGPLSRYAPGPQLEGLFLQSGFGIVTSMTFWLRAKPEHFQSYIFTLDEDAQTGSILSNLRGLQAQGVIKPCSFALWNRYKFLASQMQYPFERLNGAVGTSEDLLGSLKPAWRKTKWFGFGALYSASAKIAREERRLVRRALKRGGGKTLFLHSKSAQLLSIFQRPISWLTEIDVAKTLDSLFFRSAYLGCPIDTSLRSVYWRKSTVLPAELHPDRDRCGVIWLCHIVPYTAAEVQSATSLVESIVLEHGFEPNAALLAVSERSLHLFVVLLYDRDVAGQDQLAMDCHDQLFTALERNGYSANRLGIHSMRLMNGLSSEHRELLGRLKQCFDPQGIIAPGRYEFR